MAEAASKLPSKAERETPAPGSGEWPPLVNLRREIDRLFEDFGFGDYYLSERRFGSFQRSFQVAESVDADKIVANFKDGLPHSDLAEVAGSAEEREEDRDYEGLSLRDERKERERSN